MKQRHALHMGLTVAAATALFLVASAPADAFGGAPDPERPEATAGFAIDDVAPSVAEIFAVGSRAPAWRLAWTPLPEGQCRGAPHLPPPMLEHFVAVGPDHPDRFDQVIDYMLARGQWEALVDRLALQARADARRRGAPEEPLSRSRMRIAQALASGTHAHDGSCLEADGLSGPAWETPGGTPAREKGPQ